MNHQIVVNCIPVNNGGLIIYQNIGVEKEVIRGIGVQIALIGQY